MMTTWRTALIGLVGLGGFAAISLPLINGVVDAPIAVVPTELAGKTTAFASASPIIQTSCLPCHSSRTVLPWYAQFPVAKQLIRADIQQAQAAINLEEALYTPHQAPNAETLTQVEEVIRHNEMPPLKYAAMHWRSWITPEKKKILLAWIQAERQAGQSGRDSLEAVAPEFLNEPVQPLPRHVSIKNSEKVALGFRLYHDQRLSGDGTVSCASCHALSKGGTDQQPVSTGIHGQQGPINAPTVYNAVYNSHQFWDGRANDLAEQALGPVTNPKEMGGQWSVILPLLSKEASYAAAFKAVYGSNALTKEQVADAIAAFEATLITPDSAFDRYLRGEKTALTPQQLNGYALFKTNRCTTCHAGKALGGQGFKKLGIQHDYIADRGHPTEADNGRFNVTQRPGDKGLFKVPTLRNVAVTGPYFHDGQVKTLEDAIDKMAYYQLGQRLSASEIRDMAAFLRSLTGTYQGYSLTDTRALQSIQAAP
ncbi:MAG: cytochrome c peroxidase [Vampirovibrionales bacterium]